MIPFARKLVASFELFAGSLDPSQLPELLEAFETWAKCYGADEMCVVVPPSWRSSFPGWTPVVTMTRKVRAGDIDNIRVVTLDHSTTIN